MLSESKPAQMSALAEVSIILSYSEIKSFMGEILVGTLNPANKKKQEIRDDEKSQSNEDDEDDKDNLIIFIKTLWLLHYNL